MDTPYASVGDVLFGKTRQAVLRLLFIHPDESFHLRQVQRLTGVGLGPVQRELKRLTDSGLVTRTPRGRQVFFQVNRDSPVYSALRELVIKTAGLADVIREDLAPLRSDLDIVLVFGSFASGENHRGSDIDLLIVSDRVSLGRVASAMERTQQDLNREINPILYSRDEFAQKVRNHHPFLSRLLEGPKIFIVGDENDLKRLAA